MPSTRAAACCGSSRAGCRARSCSRATAQASSGRSLRAWRSSRRHQRALVFVDDERRQRSGHAGDEGLSYVRAENGRRFQLKDAVDAAGDLLIGPGDDGGAEADGICSASSSTTWGPSRTTCTRATSRRSSWAGKASRRRITSRRSSTRLDNNFPYTFMGLEPGTTKADVRRCLERWNKGDNGILILSRAFRLEPGTGWQINPAHPARAGLARHLRAAGGQRRVRHVPVRGRRPHRAVGADDEGRAEGVSPGSRLSGRAARLGRQRQPGVRQDRTAVFPSPVRPFAETEADGYREHWVCLRHRLLLREGADRAAGARGRPSRTRPPTASSSFKATARSGKLAVSTPAMIRYGQMTEDELFVTEAAARAGVRSRTAARPNRSSS